MVPPNQLSDCPGSGDPFLNFSRIATGTSGSIESGFGATDAGAYEFATLWFRSGQDGDGESLTVNDLDGAHGVVCGVDSLILVGPKGGTVSPLCQLLDCHSISIRCIIVVI